MNLAESIWKEVSGWKYFERDTLGKQWVRAADSIAANISEGFHRCSYRENKQFLYYARGSLQESMTWLKKAHNRNLVNEEVFQELLNGFSRLGPQLNNYIRSIGQSSNFVKEDGLDYPVPPEAHDE